MTMTHDLDDTIYESVYAAREQLNKYRLMLRCLCDQMMITNDLYELHDDYARVLRRWKILGPDHEWHEFDGLTRQEAEIVWRELWCLDQI